MIDGAKAEFAKFREVRERIEKLSAVIAACLLLAYEDLQDTYRGKSLMRQTPAGTVAEREGLTGLKNSYGQEGRFALISGKNAAKNVGADADGDSSMSNKFVAIEPMDVSVSILKGRRLGQWTVSESKEWIQAVSTAIESTRCNSEGEENKTAFLATNKRATQIYMESLEREAATAKAKETRVLPKSALSMFNTTTIKGRAANFSTQQQQLGCKDVVKAKVHSGGQLLLEMRGRLHSLLEDKKVSSSGSSSSGSSSSSSGSSSGSNGSSQVNSTQQLNTTISTLFREALDYRVKFEDWLIKEAELAAKEAQRMRKEADNKAIKLETIRNLQEEERVKYKAAIAAATAVEENEEEVELEEADLMELLGGAPVNNGNSFVSSTSVDRKKRNKEGGPAGDTGDTKRVKVEKEEEAPKLVFSFV